MSGIIRVVTKDRSLRGVTERYRVDAQPVVEPKVTPETQEKLNNLFAIYQTRGGEHNHE